MKGKKRKKWTGGGKIGNTKQAKFLRHGMDEKEKTEADFFSFLIGDRDWFYRR